MPVKRDGGLPSGGRFKHQFAITKICGVIKQRAKYFAADATALQIVRNRHSYNASRLRTFVKQDSAADDPAIKSGREYGSIGVGGGE